MNWYVETMARDIDRERHADAEMRRLAALAREHRPHAAERLHRLVLHGGPVTMVLTLRLVR